VDFTESAGWIPALGAPVGNHNGRYLCHGSLDNGGYFKAEETVLAHREVALTQAWRKREAVLVFGRPSDVLLLPAALVVCLLVMLVCSSVFAKGLLLALDCCTLAGCTWPYLALLSPTWSRVLVFTRRFPGLLWTLGKDELHHTAHLDREL
jgi:hypothetical protein